VLTNATAGQNYDFLAQQNLDNGTPFHLVYRNTIRKMKNKLFLQTCRRRQVKQVKNYM
jgi:hypothetical protein